MSYDEKIAYLEKARSDFYLGFVYARFHDIITEDSLKYVTDLMDSLIEDMYRLKDLES